MDKCYYCIYLAKYILIIILFMKQQQIFDLDRK
jgi:hypothetical protein